MKYMVDLRLIWFEFEGTNHDYDLAQDMPPMSWLMFTNPTVSVHIQVAVPC